jgi:hypothetical protein
LESSGPEANSLGDHLVLDQTSSEIHCDEQNTHIIYLYII